MDTKTKAFLNELEIATGNKAKRVKAEFAKAINLAEEMSEMARADAAAAMPRAGWIALVVVAVLCLAAGYAIGKR